MTVVRTATGSVAGLGRGGVDVFRGIPYAASTGGDARWQPPSPPRPWAGTLDATRWAPAAPQAPSPLGLAPGAEQSEDCLTLNIWTPSVEDRLPVMVWIHGGGFTSGSGATPWYSGTRLARRGVVVVTINYRLGALGFLDLSAVDPDRWPQSANAGLLDQRAALLWIRENIAAFGGDPSMITVFGESAGAMSVASHLVMDGSRGLFQRAVMQSGALGHCRSVDDSGDVAERIVSHVGGVDELARCSADRIIEAQTTVGAQVGAYLPFGPTNDGDVMPTDPLVSLAAGSAADVPIIIGTNRDEDRLFTAFRPDLPVDDGRLERSLARALELHGSALGPTEAASVYRSRLGPDATMAAVVGAAMTDIQFRVPACELADRQSVHGDVRSYLFEWASDAWDGRLGSCHAMEIPFVFDNLAQPGVGMLVGGSPPEELATSMADSWVAFAQGRAVEVRVGHEVLAWPTHDPTTRPTMVFGMPSRIEGDPHHAERAIWMAMDRA